MSTRSRTRRLVLVVEDDEDAAKVIAYALSSQGHRVIICHNGTEAVELTRRHRPDLLTLDVTIPGLNGAEVLRQLRADAGTARLPIICISAQPDPNLASADRAYFYIEKPVDIDKLRELTERAFAAAAGGGAA